MKAFLISGDRSGVGKTTITLALCSLLAKEGVVQAYKTAMDYLDASYLAGVTKRPAYNLDSFVQSDEETAGLFAYGAKGADYCVVEGVRGLFEGRDALSDAGSTASIAKRFNLPVILVINAKSITRSAAAAVLGFQKFDPDVSFAGVILNNVGSKRHVEKAKEAIEHYCGLPVFGAIPRDPIMELASRHLGLVSYHEMSEDSEFAKRIEEITEFVSQYVDIEAIQAAAGEMEAPENTVTAALSTRPTPTRTVAIAYDAAFNFYYGETEAILASLGCEVEYFSPLKDSLPKADGYIFGGGYPEVYAKELAKNQKIREEIARAAQAGAKIYAECGGLMYLTRSITVSGTKYPMCGVIPGDCVMPAKKRLGYIIGEAVLNGKTLPFKGHEFHYSGVEMDDGIDYAFTLSRGTGISNGKDGAIRQNVVAGYAHLMPVAAREIYRELFGGGA